MATLFFARTGDDPNRANRGIPVSIDLVVEKLGSLDKRHKHNPPVIRSPDGRNPLPYSAATQSVVEIESHEVGPAFPKAGYYWFPGVTPARCSELLDLGLHGDTSSS